MFARSFLGFGEGLLRSFVRLFRVLHSLPRMFVAGHMIFLSVMGSRRAMGMCRHLVKFRRPSVISIWHGALLLQNYRIRSHESSRGNVISLCSNYVSSLNRTCPSGLPFTPGSDQLVTVSRGCNTAFTLKVASKITEFAVLRPVSARHKIHSELIS